MRVGGCMRAVHICAQMAMRGRPDPRASDGAGAPARAFIQPEPPCECLRRSHHARRAQVHRRPRLSALTRGLHGQTVACDLQGRRLQRAHQLRAVCG